MILNRIIMTLFLYIRLFINHDDYYISIMSLLVIIKAIHDVLKMAEKHSLVQKSWCKYGATFYETT